MVPRPRPHLRRLAPYEWEASTQDIAAATGLPESQVIRFDTNTAPWPPVAWEQTVLDLPRVPANEYPHPSNEPLRSALAERIGVAPEQVVVTAGADESLYLIASAYLGAGRRSVLPTPTFAMFRVVAETFGSESIDVPLDEEWNIPLKCMLEAVALPKVSVIWLCSPNNPTGQLVAPEVLERVLNAAPQALVVMDEAYYEFSGMTAVSLLAQHENLAIVRTFSKGYGLAGARVGYVIASPPVARVLDAVRPPQNISVFGIAAACRALADTASLEARVASIHAERVRLAKALESRGWTVAPSHANFLLARPPMDATSLARWLQGGGLVPRSYGGNPRLKRYLRLTVRAPGEDNRLLARIDTFPG